MLAAAPPAQLAAFGLHRLALDSTGEFLGAG